MKTLQDDIDDLDRMVDTEAQKDAIRSQIRLISREVAALEAEYSQLAQGHAELQRQHAKLQQSKADEIAKLKQAHADEIARLTAPQQQIIPDVEPWDSGLGMDDIGGVH